MHCSASQHCRTCSESNVVAVVAVDGGAVELVGATAGRADVAIEKVASASASNWLESSCYESHPRMDRCSIDRLTPRSMAVVGAVRFRLVTATTSTCAPRR